MPKVVLFKQDGSKAGEIKLADEVFAVEEHQQAVFDAVIAERAGMRQGTQKAKTRSEVSGGGRKPWRQKGTGRARQGSIRAAQWSGGGIVFAPTPRDHSIKVNKKVVKLAMCCALSDKVRNNEIYVLDNLVLDSFKTKGMADVLKALNVADKKVILVLDEMNENVQLAGRNIANLLIQTNNHASVYQMMNAKSLVITEAAVKKFEEALK